MRISESKQPRNLSVTKTEEVLLIPPTTNRLSVVRVGGGEGRRVLTVSLSTVMVILDWKMEWKGGGGRGIVMLHTPSP